MTTTTTCMVPACVYVCVCDKCEYIAKYDKTQQVCASLNFAAAFAFVIEQIKCEQQPHRNKQRRQR